jgi:isopentenyl diphosphate isomerase/L-lactate dehydrogenase-like FMN-dependent dehydrogenase
MMAWREFDLANMYHPFSFGEGLGNYLNDPAFCAKLLKPPKEDMRGAISLWSQIFGDTSLTWEDLKFLRDHTKLPILLKGILHSGDAELALNYGVDGAIAALNALPKVCDVAQGKVPVLFDSGIRRGADVVKALPLGASAVLLGRPYDYGLALAVEQGVQKVIRNLIADMDLTIALSGRKSVVELDRTLLVEAKN